MGTEENCPDMRVINMEKNMAKFAPEKSDLTADGVKAFVNGVLDGSIKRHLTSEEVPDNSDNAVKVIVGKTSTIWFWTQPRTFLLSSMPHGADTANPSPQSGRSSVKNTRTTPTLSSPCPMPPPTSSRMSRSKVSQPSNSSQPVVRCKTTTVDVLLRISSNSWSQMQPLRRQQKRPRKPLLMPRTSSKQLCIGEYVSISQGQFTFSLSV